MSSLVEVDVSVLTYMVEGYLRKAKELHQTGLGESIARKIEYLKEYQSSFWMKVLFKKPSPLEDLEAEARKACSYQHRVYYARRMAFVEKFKSIIEDPSSVKKIFLTVEDRQHLIDCDVIYDYDITGHYGQFMKKLDWM